MAILSKYNLFVAFLFFSCLTTAQLSTVSWVKSIGGAKVDEGYGIETDSKGNIITSGNFIDSMTLVQSGKKSVLKSNGSQDAFIIKHDPSGNILWSLAIGSKTVDEALFCKIDKQDNIYVAGGYSDTIQVQIKNGSTQKYYSSGYEDAYVIKLNSQGEVLWFSTLNGKLQDFARRLTLDQQNENVYVSGLFQGDFLKDPTNPLMYLNKSKGANDIFLAKLSSNDGHLIWTKTFGGKLDDFPNAVELTQTGEIIFVGTFMDKVDFDPGVDEVILQNQGTGFGNGFILNLSAEGNFNWVKPLLGTSLVAPIDIALDEHQNINITGSFRGEADFDPSEKTSTMLSPGGSGDIFVMKLDHSGVYLWSKQLGGEFDDNGLDIALDSKNNIYITGCYQYDADFDPGPGEFRLYSNNINNNDIYVCKLNQEGNFLWAKGMNGNGSDIGFGICVDQQKNIFVTGVFWQTTNFNPGPDSILLTATGRGDAFLMKITQNTVDVENYQDYELSYFPNPVSNEFTVFVNDKKDRHVDWSIYSSNGEVIQRFYTDNHLKHQTINTEQWNNGMYYIKSNVLDSGFRIFKLK